MLRSTKPVIAVVAVRTGAGKSQIDVAGYLPRIVGVSSVGLKRSVSRYVFISSISAYDDSILKKIGIDESDPVGKLKDETVEEITGETYGPLKALCEKTVLDLYGERGLVVRPAA